MDRTTSLDVAEFETNSIYLFLITIPAETIKRHLIPNNLLLFSSYQTDASFSRLPRRCFFTIRSSRLLSCVSALSDQHVSSFLRALSDYTEDAATVFALLHFLVSAFHGWLHAYCNCWLVSLDGIFQKIVSILLQIYMTPHQRRLRYEGLHRFHYSESLLLKYVFGVSKSLPMTKTAGAWNRSLNAT